MKAQERTEQVLRDIHILLSKAEPYGNSEVNIVVNREEVLQLLKKLNLCFNDMLDEYQLTEEGRDRARREEAKEREEKELEAKKNAEDVYAASLLYTDNALKEITRIMDGASHDMEQAMRNMKEELEKQQDKVRSNQLELKSQLGNLIDTEKYMKLIDEENSRRRLANGETEEEAAAADKPAYADMKPEIKINADYFRANGIPVEEDEQKDEKEEETMINSDDLDAEYFGWQEEQDKEAENGEEKKTSKKSFFSLW